MQWSGQGGDIMKKMKLNIQLFAEEVADAVEPTVAEETPAQEVEAKQPSFTELLKNPEYQREFDKLVDKSLTTAKTNWEKDIRSQLEKERTEAEKLAKMDADQKIKYELNKAKSEKEALQSELNAINLYKTASSIAEEKGLPSGYLDLIDFSKENADTITDKISKLQEIRAKDLENYLNNRLRQPTPTEKKQEVKKIDPYIAGFLSEF